MGTGKGPAQGSKGAGPPMPRTFPSLPSHHEKAKIHPPRGKPKGKNKGKEKGKDKSNWDPYDNNPDYPNYAGAAPKGHDKGKDKSKNKTK